MPAVLTDSELAKLLQIEPPLVARLIEESDLPRVRIAGHVRFITQDVLAWLSEQTSLLEPLRESVQSVGDPEAAKDVAPSERDTMILPATEDEAPFVSREALSALGRHAADPSYNLMRQQVRDGVAALGDALHPTLIQLEVPPAPLCR